MKYPHILNFSTKEKNQQEKTEVINKLIVKWAIIVAPIRIKHSNTVWFILVEEKKKPTIMKTLMAMVTRLQLGKVLFLKGF